MVVADFNTVFIIKRQEEVVLNILKQYCVCQTPGYYAEQLFRHFHNTRIVLGLANTSLRACIKRFSFIV